MWSRFGWTKLMRCPHLYTQYGGRGGHSAHSAFLSPITAFSSFLYRVLCSDILALYILLVSKMLASRISLRSRCCRGLRAPRNRYFHDLPSSPQSEFLKISEEVRDAVATGKPVVALETTIYTHGRHQIILDLALKEENSHSKLYRIPIPREYCPSFAVGVCCSRKWWCPCNYRYPRGCCPRGYERE